MIMFHVNLPGCILYIKIYNSASSLEAAVHSSSFEVVEDETTNFSVSVWRTLTRTDTFTGPKSGCKRKKFGVLMWEKLWHDVGSTST